MAESNDAGITKAKTSRSKSKKVEVQEEHVPAPKVNLIKTSKAPSAAVPVEAPSVAKPAERVVEAAERVAPPSAPVVHKKVVVKKKAGAKPEAGDAGHVAASPGPSSAAPSAAELGHSPQAGAVAPAPSPAPQVTAAEARPAPSDGLKSTRGLGVSNRDRANTGLGYSARASFGQGANSQGNRSQGNPYPQNQGGYQNNRPGNYGRPAGPGQQGSGYQGNRPQGQGGYQGNRPNNTGAAGTGFGPRPGPRYNPQDRGRPGAGPGRGPGAAPITPVGQGKTATRKPSRGKKQVYSHQEEELEKELQLKKKADAQAVAIPRSVDIMETVSVADLARKMNLKPGDLIAKLMKLGVMATINQQIDSDTASILAAEYNCEVKVVSLYDETVISKQEDKPEELLPRPPVVTVMGHVDHGKTKLLDAIRSTNVIAGEFGGITQHIGAYQVTTNRGKVTFLDTPGHAAFTLMRARGAQVTDIVVLVVAADDGVMPQTLEAIDHAKAADLPIIVAINKIDLPEANPDRVRTQLSDRGLVPEAWGGTTMFCEISAKQKLGLDELYDAILLQAEVLELKANYDRHAEGKIIESRIDQGRGIVASLIIERGTLRVGDPFVAGIYHGKVRAMFNDHGSRIDEATPATPVEVIGLEGLPNAGDPFEVVADEKFARGISDKRQELKRHEQAKNVKKVSLDNFHETIKDSEVKELKVLIKGDVQGSVEAIKGLLEKLSTSEVRLNVLRSAAGAISEDDVMLASTSGAIVIAFNVRPTANAKILADQEKVDIRKYNIIYRVEEDIRTAMEGLLAPTLQENEIGKIEVREIFKVPKIGTIAGSFVLEGLVRRNCFVRVIRDSVELHQGKISSLRRFKDDAREVQAGFECGIGIDGFNDLQPGDMLEVYETVEIARTL